LPAGQRFANVLSMFSYLDHTRFLTPVAGPRRELPLYLSRVPAGFPSPGDDFADGTLDLNDLVAHPSASFLVRVSGQSMTGAGIDDGDLLVVDRSREARHGNIVIAVAHGEMTVKRLERRADRWWLVPRNADYPALPLPEDGEIWGVVAHTIKSYP
jgi:DNA polymerase V